MKTVLLSLLTLSALSADSGQTTEVQLDGWYADTTGTFQNNGTVIDLVERGFENKITPSIGVDFNGESSFTNIKINYTHIGQEQKKVIESDIQHNGLNFDKTEMSKSTLKTDIVDAIYYVDAAKDDFAELDLGLGVRYVNGSYATEVCSKKTITKFHQLVPVSYIGATVEPSSVPVKWVSSLLFSPINIEHIDLRTALKKEIYQNINLEVGYRYNIYDNKDGYSIDLSNKGVYVAGSYKF